MKTWQRIPTYKCVHWSKNGDRVTVNEDVNTRQTGLNNRVMDSGKVCKFPRFFRELHEYELGRCKRFDLMKWYLLKVVDPVYIWAGILVHLWRKTVTISVWMPLLLCVGTKIVLFRATMPENRQLHVISLHFTFLNCMSS